jgi:CRP-like cAMP-binding protein
LAQQGSEDEQIVESLKNRKSKLIDEQLKLNRMETQDILKIMEKVIILKKTNLFSTTPENILVEVAGLLKEQRFDKGTRIFNKGDKGDCMYIIYSGKVKIHDGDSVLATFDEKNFFGDLAMLDTEPRSADATAETDSVLLRLEQEAIYELMDDRIEVAQGIIKTLCERIRNLNTKYVENKR